MKTLEVPADCMIRLPKRLFRPAEHIAILTADDTLIIKKLDSPRLSSIAKRVMAKPPVLRAIAREVAAYRRARRPR